MREGECAAKLFCVVVHCCQASWLPAQLWHTHIRMARFGACNVESRCSAGFHQRVHPFNVLSDVLRQEVCCEVSSEVAGEEMEKGGGEMKICALVREREEV